MANHWKYPPTLVWPGMAATLPPRPTTTQPPNRNRRQTSTSSSSIHRKCTYTTSKFAINFRVLTVLEIIYSVHYNKTEILTLGTRAVAADAGTTTTTTAGRGSGADAQPDAQSVGTGRSGASVYPFPAFPLVLSPQRAKSISTYAPQQQFFSNHAPAAAVQYRPRVVYSGNSQGMYKCVVGCEGEFNIDNIRCGVG